MRGRDLGAILKSDPVTDSQKPSISACSGAGAPAVNTEGRAQLTEVIGQWRDEVVSAAEKKMPPRKQRFTTWSDLEVPALVTPADHEIDYMRDLGLPGEYPYTRGVQSTMYRSRLWTMRMFAGFGTPEDTNARFRYLVAQGQTGLSTAFDFPTLMGYDSDSPRSLGEVGRCGVAVDTLADMEILFDGIDLEKITTSMTINGPAIVLLAFYFALGDVRGVSRAKLGGTVQADCLKEFIAQHAWIVPPAPAMRLVTDMIEFCTHEAPRFNSISISGYHIREAGATATQELAFTLANGLSYVDHAIERGLDVDEFAPRLSFFFDVHNDFFEEIAKFRAARRMWARFMKERYGAKLPASMKLRTHAQTAGVSLTAQQPYNNVARTAIQALAAVLGGTQSLHTNSLDETYALPTEDAVRIALRTQQIIADETGVANLIDPLGGSYHVEWLTDRIEMDALEIIAHTDHLGGMVAAVEQGYPQQEISRSAYEFERKLGAGERVRVGVNRYQEGGEGDAIPTLQIDESVEKSQVASLADVRDRRDPAVLRAKLDDIRAALRDNKNVMGPMIEAAKGYATQQEICDILREEMGSHTDPGAF